MNSYIPEDTDTPSAAQSIEILEEFFALIDSHQLFNNQAREAHHQLRRAVSAALNTLLLKERPFLETQYGLDWPYAELAKRQAALLIVTEEHPSVSIRQEALLFLTQLPFPGQWDWLNRVETDGIDHPELKAFIEAERQNIRHKLSKKRQKAFRPDNFCQILKRPQPRGEKGVLRIFSMLHAFVDRDLLRALNRRYILYIEPPWGVIYRNTWLRAFMQMQDPCIIGLGGDEDRRFVRNQSGMVTTSLAHGEFVDPQTPFAIGVKKQFDIVFNGTFEDMPRKRHRLMLQLLNHPLLADKTALIIGVGQSKNADRFRADVREHGLENRVSVRDNLSRAAVDDYLGRCRMAVHLALNENVCRCIYEFFRADLPCVMTTATAGMDLSHFNALTGMVVSDAQLPQTIRSVLADLGRFSPRRWFLSHSGRTNSSLKLNRQLKSLFAKRGYRWTEDIVELGSHGADRYVTPEDKKRFVKEFDDLYDLFQNRHPLPIRLVR